jgi:hypothetical protein
MEEIEIPAFLRRAGKEQTPQPIERSPAVSTPVPGLYSGTDDQPVMSRAPLKPVDFGGRTPWQALLGVGCCCLNHACHSGELALSLSTKESMSRRYFEALRTRS